MERVGAEGIRMVPAGPPPRPPAPIRPAHEVRSSGTTPYPPAAEAARVELSESAVSRPAPGPATRPGVSQPPTGGSVDVRA